MATLSAQPRMAFPEFISLLALCMSLVPLAIDALLPALSAIGESFDLKKVNDNQLVITFLFVGLAIGQLVAGPLSDSIGRKAGIYFGLALFATGSLISYFAQSFETLLAGRFIQGLGVAGPRVITVAMVRDRYGGREMARVMSYVMGIFVLMPAAAPAIGQAIMLFFGWRAVLLLFIVISAIVFIWLSTRLPETMHPEDRRPFTGPSIWYGIKTVCTNRITTSYMVSAGFIFGAFIGYLNSAQQIFQDFGVAEMFPVYFAISALTIGVAFFINGWLVSIFGMRLIIIRALVSMATCAATFLVFQFLHPGSVPLWTFVTFIAASTFFMGLLFGNINALAMVPMGHMAGVASAVIGCVSLLVSATAGLVIGQLYDGSVGPVTGGFLVMSIASLMVAGLAETGKELEEC